MENNQITTNNEDTIISFLAFFNEIDKHFDKILGEEGFSPYNEKLKKISEGNYSITGFIRKHIYTLRSFWELRNFITHGIKTNGETFANPTPAAIKKIAQYAESITKPPRVIDIFKKEVYTAQTQDFLKEVIPTMKKRGYTQIPVYQDKNFIGVLSEAKLLYRLADFLLYENYINISATKIQHIPLEYGWKEYLFVSQYMSIYEAGELFNEKKQRWEKLSVLFITATGSPDEEILGLISRSDATIIDQYLLL